MKQNIKYEIKDEIKEAVLALMSTRKIANTCEGRQQIIDEIHKFIDFKYPHPEPIIDISLNEDTGIFTINLEIGNIYEEGHRP